MVSRLVAASSEIEYTGVAEVGLEAGGRKFSRVLTVVRLSVVVLWSSAGELLLVGRNGCGASYVLDVRSASEGYRDVKVSAYVPLTVCFSSSELAGVARHRSARR